jgi:hypothetical protein
MKRSDLFVLAGTILAFLPFIIFPAVYDFYLRVNHAYPYLLSFLKFGLLATFGESIGLRIRKGVYWEKGFGMLPRAIVWGVLGVSIKMAFVIFGEGAPKMMETLGFQFPTANPADVLRQPVFSWIKLLAAFSVGFTLNIFFAPVFMAFHQVTDLHIIRSGGTLRGFFRPFPFGQYMQDVDWKNYWNFILKKTVPFFWIPAQTLNFLLPEEWRILVAAFYSIILGVFLSVTKLTARKK